MLGAVVRKRSCVVDFLYGLINRPLTEKDGTVQECQRVLPNPILKLAALFNCQFYVTEQGLEKDLSLLCVWNG